MPSSKYDPESKSPKKISPEDVQKKLSKKAMARILYECDLLRITPDRLYQLDSSLFTIEEEKKVPEVKKVEEVDPLETHYNGSHNHGYDADGYYDDTFYGG